MGKLIPQVKSVLGEANGSRLLAQLESAGKVVIDVAGEQVELDTDDIRFVYKRRPVGLRHRVNSVVVLNTELTDELIREGYARDLIQLIQIVVRK